MKAFYITTPIYYVNDRPHLGTAYSTVLADILNRYYQYFNVPTRFITGLDEHGQKCQQVADQKKISPQDHCDQMTEIFKNTWNKLEIQYDHFYRTTSPSHTKRVKRALQQLYDNDYIYKSTYEGWYCVSDEIFYTSKDLVDGLSPTGKEVTKIKETNYFFRLSQFKQPLLKHLEQNPTFIQPLSRQNEVMGFLNNSLDDLCISRPKERMSWGIELPFDTDYTLYVWVDALMNYIFAAGLWSKEMGGPDEQQVSFEKWWPHSFHLIGKDILITHAVYWTGLLMALNIPLPKKIISHGWLLNKDQEKMSKSKGESINPLQVMDKIGADPLRYFFIKSIKLGSDAPISVSMIHQEYNQGLANNLGNLLQRVSKLVNDHFEGKVPEYKEEYKDNATTTLIEDLTSLSQSVKKDIESFLTEQACRKIVNLLNKMNKYLEDTEPWKLVKTDKERTGSILYIALEVLRVTSSLLQPVMPQSTNEILKRLGLDYQSFKETDQPNKLKAGQPILYNSPVFPRIQNET